MVKESGNPDKETDYIGGIVYEDDTRKFIGTEEGRIMLESAPEYQYHMKDHLGNVRLTFTTTEQTSTYLATMESAASTVEGLTFDNIDNTRHQDALYNHTDTTIISGANKSARLNAVGNRVMGPAMSLHVMPGDDINMTVWAKYTQAANSTNPVTGMAAIVAAAAGVGGVTEAAQVTAGLNDILGAGQAAVFSDDNTIPKAYINYLFFDKNKQYKSGGFKQVGTASLNNLDDLNLSFSPTEEGYMIIYVANQTNEDLNVYMDDMTIEHTEGPIIRADDYYPFGLTFNSSERSGYTTNRHLFNGNEIQTDLGLDLYDFNRRFYDDRLGRFINIDPLADDSLQFRYSPYQYSWNNPILRNDPDGEIAQVFWGAVIGAATEYGSQVIGNAIKSGKGFKAFTESSTWTNIDASDIVVAAGVGAATGGLSAMTGYSKAAITGGKAVVTAFGESAKAAADVNVNLEEGTANTKSIYTGDKAISDAAVEFVIGNIPGPDVLGKTASNAAESAVEVTVNAVQSTAKQSISKIAKEKIKEDE